MPFKPGHSFTEVNRNLDGISNKIDNMVGRGIYVAATIGAGHAKTLTPVDTSNLINSQYISVNPYGNGWRGEVSYTANYAAAVHVKPGTLKGRPRPKNRGLYWSPSGEPHFLTKGFEQNAVEIRTAFIQAIKL